MAFVMGVAFGVLYQHTGDLGGPIGAHATINFLNLLHIATTAYPEDMPLEPLFPPPSVRPAATPGPLPLGAPVERSAPKVTEATETLDPTKPPNAPEVLETTEALDPPEPPGAPEAAEAPDATDPTRPPVQG